MKRLMIIPAAGLGLRLHSGIPKPLAPVNGRPMLDHLLDLYLLIVDVFILVVNPSHHLALKNHCESGGWNVEFEEQPEPTGMLDAVLIPVSRVQRHDPDQIWITWCDTISIDPRTVAKLSAASSLFPDATLIFPTVKRRSPYIHIERNEKEEILNILHAREKESLPQTGESDLGLFCLSRNGYLQELPVFSSEAKRGGETKERNFLPFIPWLSRRAIVKTIEAANEIESVGINTPEELKQVEQHLVENRRKLSVIIPAYNEEKFIAELLRRVIKVDLAQLGIVKEVIVVNDHSTDSTGQIVTDFTGVILVNRTVNGGKGEAVKDGIQKASGDYIIIQDADLEYDPEDYLPMLKEMLTGHWDGIYGSRYMRGLFQGKYKNQSWLAYWGGRSLSFLAKITTGQFLTDTVTALKLFKLEVLKSLPLESNGFELDHEITSRVLARGYKLREVSIHYYPRSRAQGKKIGFKDWLSALRTFVKYRNG